MKLKTHKATVKRIKETSTGKIMRTKSAKSHLLSHKANPTKTDLVLASGDAKKVRRMVPYLSK